jgi:hypothetical protein
VFSHANFAGLASLQHILDFREYLMNFNWLTEASKWIRRCCRARAGKIRDFVIAGLAEN